MSIDKALKDLVTDELKKALSKMKYKIDAEIAGAGQITFHTSLPFPPYIGLKLKIKEKNGSYIRVKIIDLELDVERQVFNVLCELY